MTPEACAAELGGNADDWARLKEAWGDRFADRMALLAGDPPSLRVRMLGGSHIGYARLTRRWWTPVRDELEHQELGGQPLYFIGPNPRSPATRAAGVARD